MEHYNKKSNEGRRMRTKWVMCVFILVAMGGAAGFAEASAGKLVFAIREPFPDEDGFRAATRTLEKGRDNDLRLF